MSLGNHSQLAVNQSLNEGSLQNLGMPSAKVIRCDEEEEEEKAESHRTLDSG